MNFPQNLSIIISKLKINKQNCTKFSIFRHRISEKYAWKLEQTKKLRQKMSLHGILKINIDCLEELFEWLSLTDLFSLRQTCTRLKYAVDYHVRTNYPMVKYVKTQTDDDFAQFCQIDPSSINPVNHLNDAKNCCQTEKIDNILKQAVSITVRYDQFEGDYYGIFLKYCKQLRSVTILFIYGDISMGTSNEWLLRRYPMLRHIYFEDTDISGVGFAEKIVELKTFFELNPNISSFSSSSHFLEQNGDCLKGAHAQIDQLIIHSDCYQKNGMNGICDFVERASSTTFLSSVASLRIVYFLKRRFG